MVEDISSQKGIKSPGRQRFQHRGNLSETEEACDAMEARYLDLWICKAIHARLDGTSLAVVWIPIVQRNSSESQSSLSGVSRLSTPFMLILEGPHAQKISLRIINEQRCT